MSQIDPNPKAENLQIQFILCQKKQNECNVILLALAKQIAKDKGG